MIKKSSPKDQRVLVVEDDPQLLRTLSAVLKENNYLVTPAITGQEALEQLADFDLPDVVILDINLPDRDGFSVLQKIRGHYKTSQLPVLILTAKNDEVDVLKGFRVGADDYITKPFAIPILLARIKSAIRRQSGLLDHDLTFGDVCIYTQEDRVSVNGEDLALTQNEFVVLKELMSAPGKVFSREHLLDRFWEDNERLSIRVIDTVISRLRGKLSESRVQVKTRRSSGYYLSADE